ncbi:hypothetical protein Esti_005675 [Eimeria stiedai]
MGTFVEGENNQYAVEDIIAIKREFGRFLFLVKWKGWDDPEENTWEPIQSFQVSRNFEFRWKIEELKRWYWDSGQAEREREERQRQKQLQLLQQQQRRQQQQQGRRKERAKQKQQQQQRKQQQQQQQRGKGLGRERGGIYALCLAEPSSSKTASPPPVAGPPPPSVSVPSEREPTAAPLAAPENDARCENKQGSRGALEDRSSRLTLSTETVSSQTSAYPSESSSSSSSLPSDSDSSYSDREGGCESRRERRRKERDRQRARQRREGGLAQKPRQGFPPPVASSAPEPYLSRELEQLDLLRLRERQQQTGGKVSSIRPPPPRPNPPSSSSSRRRRKRKTRGHEVPLRLHHGERMQQHQQQKQQRIAAAAGSSRKKGGGPHARCRSREEGGPRLRGSRTQRVSSSGRSSRSSSPSSCSSSCRKASDRKRPCSSPLQSWLEGEEEAPELLPAELGSKENAYLEFTGDWDSVARANFRCRQLGKLQQQLQGPNQQQQEQQRLLKQVGQWTGALIPAVLARQQQERSSRPQPSAKGAPGGPQGTPQTDDEYEVVGLEMGEAGEAAGEESSSSNAAVKLQRSLQACFAKGRAAAAAGVRATCLAAAAAGVLLGRQAAADFLA